MAFTLVKAIVLIQVLALVVGSFSELSFGENENLSLDNHHEDNEIISTKGRGRSPSKSPSTPTLVNRPSPSPSPPVKSSPPPSPPAKSPPSPSPPPPPAQSPPPSPTAQPPANQPAPSPSQPPKLPPPLSPPATQLPISRPPQPSPPTQLPIRRPPPSPPATQLPIRRIPPPSPPTNHPSINSSPPPPTDYDEPPIIEPPVEHQPPIIEPPPVSHEPPFIEPPPINKPPFPPTLNPPFIPRIKLPPPSIHPAGKPLIVVGHVNCESCSDGAGFRTPFKSSPLHGASVKLVCHNNGRKANVQTALTDKNGDFSIIPSSLAREDVHKCRVYLVKSPKVICSVPTDHNNGKAGAALKPIQPPGNYGPGPGPIFDFFGVGPFLFKAPSKMSCTKTGK